MSAQQILRNHGVLVGHDTAEVIRAEFNKVRGDEEICCDNPKFDVVQVEVAGLLRVRVSCGACAAVYKVSSQTMTDFKVVG